MDRRERQRAAAPVLGNLLLVAVVLVLGITLTVLSFAFLENTGTPTAEATFDFEETPAGVYLVPTALGQPVIVQLNGRPVARLTADDTGTRTFLPTAPGDDITVVSRDGDRSVLLRERVDDRSEVGDLVFYYEYAGSGSTVADRSGNGNDGTVSGATRITDGAGTGLDFDGTDDYVDAGDLTVDGPAVVDEITVAIRYRTTGGDGTIQQLIEHQPSQGSAFAWFMETQGSPGGDHRVDFNIGWNTPDSATISTGQIPGGEVQTLVGTYDGEEMVLYRNGTEVGNASLSRPVELGEVIVAADSNPSIQNLDGRIYETRLYYTAFDAEEVATLTEVMDG